MVNTLDVVVGGQFGSESKGRVTAAITQLRRQQGNSVTGVRVAGPNAGHVVLDDQGRRYALRQVPVSLVVDPMATGAIAAGSEIDLDVLQDEIDTLEADGHNVRNRLLIDREATILEPRHRDAEGGNDGPMQRRIGSTGKGVGAARADRIMRRGYNVGMWNGEGKLGGRIGTVTDTADWLRQDLLNTRGARSVVIEGTQGYGLGLHAGYYPYCTSSDCRAVDFLAMAGISPWAGYHIQFRVWVVVRPYPIRVAGNSGPLKGETSWAELGLDPEYTTVTKKERRVGAWDPDLVRRAVEANGGPGGSVRVAIAMLDQVFPEIAGMTLWEQLPILDGTRAKVADWLAEVENQIGAPVGSIGTGPASTMWLYEGLH